uniref:PLA2c domain-containing protein n=1 Tax=Terrapene triunguis TaxID=2587831 RepID=A0A674IEH5_9SAUR
LLNYVMGVVPGGNGRCVTVDTTQVIYMSKGDSSEDVPNIAILGAGGGLRAMIALHGTLQELQKHGLLDTIMYLSGVSGATWCMSSLYNNGDWAEKLQALEKHMCDALTKSTWNLRKATEMLLEAAKDENYSLTEFWAYTVVYGMLHEVGEKLSVL